MMKIRWVGISLVLTAASFAVGCGGSAGYSCTTESGGAKVCVAYTGSSYGNDLLKSAAESGCSGEGKTFSNSGCSSTDRVGTCTQNAGTDQETVQSYYSPGYTASTGESACTVLSGTWAASG